MSQRGKGSVNERKVDADDAYNRTVTRADHKTTTRVEPKALDPRKEGDDYQTNDGK